MEAEGEQCDETVKFLDNKTQFNIINTNARSLRPKISSFLTAFMNLSLVLAIVSETWLANGSALERESERLLFGHGLRLSCLNRDPLPSGVAYGGVAIITRDAMTRVDQYKFDNPLKFEVLPLSVNIKSVRRRLFAVAVYVPPNYPVARGRECLQHVSDLVLDIKRKHRDPLILVAGDFNQWDIADALSEFADMQEVETAATRGERRIDRTFVNWHDEVEDSGCLPPLETEAINGVKTPSDHKIQYTFSRMPSIEPVRFESFVHRPFTDRGASNFRADLATVDWAPVVNLEGSNPKATKLTQILMDLMDKHFPEKTVRRKETDLPWLDNWARKRIKRKSAIYRAEGASARWENARTELEEHLAKKKEEYLAKQRLKFIGPNASSEFFKNVKAFSNAEKPKTFDVRDLRPGNTDEETAKEVAEFFNRISAEFSPLEPSQIPFTYDRPVQMLVAGDVTKLLKKAKKTKSMVRGDIFPSLINDCAEHLALPLTSIYNSILNTFVWPRDWKREFVTVIPKKGIPESFSDLRNISCTQLFSKVFEGVVLARLQEEVALKKNQYGGVKGCSTTHMVIDILQEICENAEDYRSATVLTAIDYSKAFNRVSYQHCLEAFRKKGASTQTLRLLATFLTNRTMSVRVGQVWSEPLNVDGGCPQGSVLGVFLFNGTTDCLEDEYIEYERRGLRLPGTSAVASPPPNPPLARSNGTATSSPVNQFRPRSLSCPLSPVDAGAFLDMETPYRPRLSTMPRQPVLVSPPREEKVGTQVLQIKQIKFFKYVDDNIICEKVNFGNVPITRHGDANTKTKQVFPSQNAFRSVIGSAEAIGMVVNANKTNHICISDALNYKPRTFFTGSQGEVVESGDTMKVLGFTFSSRPNVKAHVDNTIKKLRQRNWLLTHLEGVGFSKEELVQVYKSVILPIADYCCPAYHSLLTDIQDQLLERAQVGALRRIFGYGKSARTLRQEAGLQTLRARRIELTDKFARKAAASPRFCHWFPKNTARRSARNTDTYVEFFAKNDRLKDSPLYYMRRRLNGKEGKIYGERNRIYRENLNDE